MAPSKAKDNAALKKPAAKKPAAAADMKRKAVASDSKANKVARKVKPCDDPNVDAAFAAEMRAWEEAEQAQANEALETPSDGPCNVLCTVIDTLPMRSVATTKAAKSLVDGIRLNDDVILPVVGYGTYKLKKGDAFAPVLKALEVGYRLIDTAQIYDNEADVGKALRQSGIPRNRVCIETKHWRSSHGYERTLTACKASMKRLGVDYIDLYLIHWPGCKTGWPLPSGTCSPPDWTPKMRDNGTWRAMEQLYKEGKVKALGVSNYSIRHLQLLLKTCKVRPTVNQVEFHPWLVQSKLLEFCKKEGIVLQAYASLGSGDVSSRADFFALKPVREAAKKYDKTSAQILLRWAMEKGVTVLPKSKSTDRMVENFGVFDFKLTDTEVANIDKCHKDKRFAWKGKDPDTVL
eukprot:TRINITY_DN50510_c0_g1_i1.p1 TRINITY_DN50510_c0_g1~~TRINITY_DN50510_c0_g1_i1.p1  ORF type:complete len:405 (-),score=58.31 TRINITY_DN50510_c0_g1_i1:75-1289(-)